MTPAEELPDEPDSAAAVDQLPSDCAPVSSELRDRKRRQLLWMLVVALVLGLLSGLTGIGETDARLMQFVATLAFAFPLFQWCELDRLELGNQRWRGFGLLLILFPGPIVILPIYLLVTRGQWGILAVVIAAGGYLGLLVASTLSEMIGLLLSGRWQT